jgi:hypothetical protein
MTLEAMLDEIRAMPVAERKRLISLIAETLIEESDITPAPQRSILEFEGVGAEMWAGVDVQEYLNRLRDEWDSRA